VGLWCLFPTESCLLRSGRNGEGVDVFRRIRVVFEKAKSDGVILAVRWAFVRGFRRIIPHRQVIWCVDLTKIDSDGFVLPDNLRIERFYSLDELKVADFRALVEARSELMGSGTERLIRERFEKGAALWMLRVDGKLAGYRWTLANNKMTPTYLPHSESDLHSIGFELFPEFRGRKLFNEFLTAMHVISKSEGFKRCYSETYLWNRRAINALLKVGMRKIGTARRFKLFGRNIVIWHDMSDKM